MSTESSTSDMTTVGYDRTTANVTQISSSVNTPLAVVYLLLSMLVMITNGIIVFVLTKIRHLHLPTLLILNFMACCDFLMGLHFFIFAMPSAFLDSFAYSDSCIGMVAMLFIILAGQNALNIAIAVVDRYIAVNKPLAYVRIVTSKKLYVVFVVSVVISLCRMAVIAFPDRDYYYNPIVAVCVTDFNTLPAVIASISPFILLCALMVLSVGMFRKLRRGRLIFPEGGLRQGVKFPHMVTLRMMVMAVVSTVPPRQLPDIQRQKQLGPVELSTQRAVR
ncbi:trace amine-associated receptor 1-like [Haliotis rubra]|uniref:trace amine-associated receptor 1-like n=1 Tax=Haliotis rubra TaxID=36100 RepID=UPI001EE4F04D|nr:trace amine-associated receptor 1-like [Haliotis rubra]